MRMSAATAIVLALGASAGMAEDETSFRARLSMVPIDPATAAAVTGVGEATATVEGEMLVVTGSFKGLQGPATEARLHAGSFTGVRGDAFADLTVTPTTAGSISGSVELSPAQLDALQSGRVYIQIHSEAAPDGNLWGWLLAD
jgi:hypothetical protein